MQSAVGRLGGEAALGTLLSTRHEIVLYGVGTAIPFILVLLLLYGLSLPHHVESLLGTGEGHVEKIEVVYHNLLVLTAGPKTIRLLPPLVISQEEMDTGLAALKDVLVP